MPSMSAWTATSTWRTAPSRSNRSGMCGTSAPCTTDPWWHLAHRRGAERAWTDMSGWPWEDAEFYEYANTGPGAEVGEGRPQLSEEEAEQVTREAYLAGSDGWAPWH